MKRTMWFIILVSLLPALAVAAGVAPPPKPLHKVGDHWTPYNPPTEFPEGAKVHVIKKGDTLWDLAKAYLGNPYLWRGMRYDADDGFYVLGGRRYDPARGRELQR